MCIRDSTWNIEENSEINVVFRPYDIKIYDNELIAYNQKGEETVFKRYKKPESQILVVKSNERLVITEKNIPSKSLADSSENALINEDGIFAYFTDSEFNNNHINTKSTLLNSPQRLLSRYEKLFYAYTHNIPYERDYVYYSLTSANSTGTLDRTQAEHLCGISFNTTASYNIVVKSSDITEGALEFYLDFMFTKRTGAAYNFRKILHIPIDQMFKSKDGKIIETYIKDPLLPVFNWDLSDFGDTFKLSILEYDNGKEVVNTHTVSSTFTDNFTTNGSFEIGVGDIKIGFGGGSSSTESNTETSTIQIKTTENSVSLGDIYVNFYENTLLDKSVTYIIGSGRNEKHICIDHNNIESYNIFLSNKNNSGSGIYGSYGINRVYDTGVISILMCPMKIQ